MAFTAHDIKSLVRKGWNGKQTHIEYEKNFVSDKSRGYLAGFGLQFKPGGSIRWILRYRVKERTGNSLHDFKAVRSKDRKKTIGSYPAMTLATARSEAKKLLGEVDSGVDPLARTVETGLTLGDWAVLYLRDKKAHDLRSTNEMLRRIYKHLVYDPKLSPHYCLNSECNSQKRYAVDEACIKCKGEVGLVPKPAFTTTRLQDISRSDVDDLHRRIGEGKGKPRYEANRVKARLSDMLSLARRKGKLKKAHVNPCRDIKDYPEEKRERVLSVEEAQALVDAIAIEEHHRFESLVWLLTFTGIRVDEARTLRWSNIELDRTLNGQPAPRMQIHRTRVKTNETHYVPLNAGAVLVLDQILKEENSDYVFPSPQRPGKPYSNQPFKKVWDRVRKRADLWDLEVLDEDGKVIQDEKRIRWHDIRRTFITKGNALQHPLHTLGALVNQSTLAVTASYAQIESETARLATDDISEKILSDLGAPKLSTRVQTRTRNTKN